MKYELHTSQGNRWLLASIYDDRELALADARNVVARKGATTSVKVLENDPDGAQHVIYLKKQATSSETLREIRTRKEREERERAAREARKARRQQYLARQSENARRTRLRLVVGATIGVLSTASACLILYFY